MNVVDSSGWLEYLAGADNAGFFAPAIHDTEALLVPVICVYEVFKRISLQRSPEAALQAVGVLLSGQILDITAELALLGARISIDHHLPMADSLILAAARANNAILWTQDEHFEGLPEVNFISRAAGAGSVHPA